MSRVAIVGGGISGLAVGLAVRDRAAREKKSVEIVVLEKEARPGGKIRTESISGYTCEWGPNGFLDNVPETLELVRRLGLEERLQVSDDAARRRFLFRGGHLHPAPAGVGAFLGSGLLSLRGKLRVMAELLIPPRRVGTPDRAPAPEDDESIRSFAARRIGSEGADILVDSIVSGIFAGDPSRLSLRACFPKMYQMETEHGGLVRAMLASRRAKRRGDGLEALRPVPNAPGPGAPAKAAGMGMPAGTLTSFRGGIEDLTQALARELGAAVQTGVSIASVSRSENGARWTVAREDGASLHADAVVLAGPAAGASHLVARLDPALANLLEQIAFASVAVVCLGFDRGSLDASLDGFGFLAPHGQGLRILGALWDSSIYPGRAPQGKALIRVMIGGARDPEAMELSDASLVGTVLQDLERAMGLTSTPEFVHVFRHLQGIPQYTLGHLDRVHRIEKLLEKHPGVFLSGNSYHGVAINSCVAEAPRVAERILSHLGTEAD